MVSTLGSFPADSMGSNRTFRSGGFDDCFDSQPSGLMPFPGRREHSVSVDILRGAQKDVPSSVSGIWRNTAADAKDESGWYPLNFDEGGITGGIDNMKLGGRSPSIDLGAQPPSSSPMEQLSQSQGQIPTSFPSVSPTQGAGVGSTGMSAEMLQQWMLTQAFGPSVPVGSGMGTGAMSIAQMHAAAQLASVSAQVAQAQRQQQAEQIAGLLPNMSTVQLQALQQQLQQQLQQLHQQEAIRNQLDAKNDTGVQGPRSRSTSFDDRSRSRSSRDMMRAVGSQPDLSRVAGAEREASKAGGSPLAGGTGVFLPVHMRESMDGGSRRSSMDRTSREYSRPSARGSMSIDLGRSTLSLDHGNGSNYNAPTRRRNALDLGPGARPPTERNAVSVDLGFVDKGSAREGDIRGRFPPAGSSSEVIRRAGVGRQALEDGRSPADSNMSSSTDLGSDSGMDMSGGWDDAREARVARPTAESGRWTLSEEGSRGSAEEDNLDSNNLPNEWIY
mmetsp:Transcript_11623/g.36804  ORF Transcript_11623/g.36804 Transcript_11623/m.36804 type:complete len:501 (+) Transcript_11623:118-1620(+)